MNILLLLLLIALLALAFAAWNYFTLKRCDEGTERMRTVAAAIRIGANAFIAYEYRILLFVALTAAAILTFLISWQSAVALLLGAFMSASAGYIGMKTATYANVRVANEARLTKNIGKTLQVAFRGGSVMGLCVGGFALFGLFIVFLVFGKIDRQLLQLNPVTNNLGISFIPFTMTLSGYALGCSLIAMFNRVGGGIYTKAADMGADLVGKTEARISEDDPRNPAAIADNVGDNVGDVAGLGSDLLESYIGAIIAAVILAFHLYQKSLYSGMMIGATLLEKLVLYPLIFVSGGLIASMIAIAFMVFGKRLSGNPHRALNGATWFAAALTTGIGLFATTKMFAGVPVAAASFTAGMLSPWISAVLGIFAGVAIGLIAEYYTSADYQPTRKLAASSLEGPALTITQGLSLGMRSCMLPLVVLGTAIILSYYVSGMYGVAMSSIGMLSFVTVTVSVDSYGPISDNAGGIAEMSHLDKEVRGITDTLDSAGNTTAAIGKGFAIGSAALAALALMVSYLYSYNDPSTALVINLLEPLTLTGALVGGALPFLFSGMLIDAVAVAARKMVDEVRRQFKENPGILTGDDTPDYRTCIEISSQGALNEMRHPSILAILVPVMAGFLFGPHFVGGLLIGSTISAIMLAIFTGNAGGAWDNAKKFIECSGLDGHSKGSDAHAASVIGDTVGDPLKDTVGPSLDIFIKIMSTVSLVAVSAFSRFNLMEYLLSLFP